MIYTIVGSGFGLYGYLPALFMNTQHQVALPKKYQQKLLARSDINKFNDQVIWVADEISALSSAQGLVLAVNPATQFGILREMDFSSYKIKELVMEKPIAPDPTSSLTILDKLKEEDLQYRVGYLFLYTDWFRKLKTVLPTTGESTVTIKWSFMAHHFKNKVETWKRYHSEGGGVLRFYGIHIIAVLSSFGEFANVKSILIKDHPDQPHAWMLSMTINNTLFHVEIDSMNTNAQFSVDVEVSSGKQSIVNGTDPFIIESPASGTDSRVFFIAQLLNSFSGITTQFNSLSYMTCFNWNRVE